MKYYVVRKDRRIVGYAKTWDGQIKQCSPELNWLDGKPIEELIRWANDNGLRWEVDLDRPGEEPCEKPT